MCGKDNIGRCSGQNKYVIKISRVHAFIKNTDSTAQAVQNDYVYYV